MIFIFPGQGSQFIGMGKDLYNNFPIVKTLFEEINDAINHNLSKIILDGPDDQLNSTENTQPAIMAVSIAVIKVLEQELGNIISHAKYVMGHSLGEYSALCAAGALTVYDTAKLLKIRGQAMQSAVPIGQGTMLALLGADMGKAGEIVQQVDNCEIANDNGGGQVVLSCLVEALEKIKKLAKSVGIKRVIELPVSAPFHSSFMKPAAEKMKEVLEYTEINRPNIPIISNVTAGEVTEAHEIRRCLEKQVTHVVRWRESILYCADREITNYIELGPGNVLSNLIRRILTSKPDIFNICDSKQISEFIDVYSQLV